MSIRRFKCVDVWRAVRPRHLELHDARVGEPDVSGSIIRRSRDGTVLDRLKVIALRYATRVERSLQRRLLSIAEIAAAPVELVERLDAQGDPELDAHGDPVRVPQWIEPEWNWFSETRMTAAFRRARRELGAYYATLPGRARAGKRLLLVFNVSDGEPTDGSPVAEIRRLEREARRARHELVMINVHVTGEPGVEPILFPSEEQAEHFDEHGRELFACSSPVPAELMPLVREVNPAAATGTAPRMMAVNADLHGLQAILRIGSHLAASPVDDRS
jgi:hypothetical protein